MWDQLGVLCALLCVAVGAPLSPTPCPESCLCTETSGVLDIRCTSLDFLEKLQPKQVSAIVSVDLSRQNITKLSGKFKKLRNLIRVDLTGNDINDIASLHLPQKVAHLNLNGNHVKYFTAASLPRHLKELDISNNYLTYIPHDLKNLPDLKVVNLGGNPISCTCDVVNERDFLGEVLVKPVSCNGPEKLRGVALHEAHCYDLLDQMQGDEPVEGSGDEAEPTADVFEDDAKSENIPGIEDEGLIPQSPSTEATHVEENVEIEGSGFANQTEEDEDYEYEGSGILDEDESTSSTVGPLSACNFDCSSPAPTNETESSEPDPNIADEIKKAFGFLPDSTSTTEETIVEVPVRAIEIDKLDTAPGTADEKEKIADTGEIKEDKASWNTNLIIVVALIAVMLCLTVYSIMKKRKKRLSAPQPIEQEMKLLQPKPTNGSNIPEKVPLMNGQNGNVNGKPVEEPVQRRRNEELDSKPPPDEVNLRKKRDEDTLLPETHRVTIQAKELSIPKTPLLVTRTRTGSGEFITTPDN